MFKDNKKALKNESKNQFSIKSLSDFELKVKTVFNMIDEENRIPQLYSMRNECLEEGRPHIAAYIENRIEILKERFAV